jgi:serine/threonine protein kinase
MEYMHCRRVLWRELKIESFVIDHQGYLTLVDLMHLEELPQEEACINSPSKATFYYLAPEILSSQGHGFEADFWSLGVGHFPYGN